MVRRVATHLMFEGSASQAIELYSSVFPSFASIESTGTAMRDLALPGPLCAPMSRSALTSSS